MDTLFIKVNAFNALRQVVCMVNVQVVAQEKVEQFWHVQTVQLYQENIPFYFQVDAF